MVFFLRPEYAADTSSYTPMMKSLAVSALVFLIVWLVMMYAIKGMATPPSYLQDSTGKLSNSALQGACFGTSTGFAIAAYLLCHFYFFKQE